MDADTPAAPTPVLPGYEILRPLGAGGTSTVWLARQVSLDRPVAVKVLAPSLLKDEQARAQFRAEAKTAGKIRHPAIVGVVDAGEAGGMLYYVMEYVEGTDLANWLAENGPLPKKVVLQIAQILAEALGSVWGEFGLVHGDIKPGNIILEKDGSIRLTDFGLARVVREGLQSAETQGVIEGTPTYLAPEEIRGEAADCRSDIYALGLTLYHLLTGKAPFEGYGLQALLEAQQTDFLPDPCSLVQGLAPSVAWLLAKMAAKQPEQRQADWGAVQEDIALVAGGKRPKPPYPGEDDSTILISARNRPTARSSVNPNAIRLTKREGTSMERQAGYQAKSSMGGWIRALVFLVLLCGGLFAAWKFDLVGKIREGMANAPRPGSVQAGKPRPAEAARADEGTVAEGEDEAETTISDTGTLVEGAWNQPQFVSAATLFNGALSRYQAAVAAKAKAAAEGAEEGAGEAPDWAGMIRDAETAAGLFETIKPMAPEGVPVRRYANQCYQLAKDCRRAMTPLREKAEAQQYARKRRQEAVAPWPLPDASADPLYAGRYMDFGYAWETLPAPQARQDATDYVMTLSGHVSPSASTRADPKQGIHYRLQWLMPLGKALESLRVKETPVRQMATGAVAPYGGVFFAEVPAGPYGKIQMGPGQEAVVYPTMRLVLDAEDQLIAVELVDPAPSGGLVNANSAFSPNHATADFITGKTVDLDKGEMVAYGIRKAGETLRLDAEAGFPAEGRPSYRSVLMLPNGVANAFAYHVMGMQK